MQFRDVGIRYALSSPLNTHHEIQVLKLQVRVLRQLFNDCLLVVLRLLLHDLPYSSKIDFDKFMKTMQHQFHYLLALSHTFTKPHEHPSTNQRVT
jgi:hypothetical protein